MCGFSAVKMKIKDYVDNSVSSKVNECVLYMAVDGWVRECVGV